MRDSSPPAARQSACRIQLPRQPRESERRRGSWGRSSRSRESLLERMARRANHRIGSAQRTTHGLTGTVGTAAGTTRSPRGLQGALPASADLAISPVRRSATPGSTMRRVPRPRTTLSAAKTRIRMQQSTTGPPDVRLSPNVCIAVPAPHHLLMPTRRSAPTFHQPVGIRSRPPRTAAQRQEHLISMPR